MFFCLTKDNLKAPWLAYEAGALASHDKAKVATFLYGVSAADVAPPLGLFQATLSSSKKDVLLLVKTMNNRLPTVLPESRLQKAFDTHWPSLESQLASIPASEARQPTKPQQDSQSILNEILAVVRRIEKDGSGRVDGFIPSSSQSFAFNIPTGSGANLGLLSEMPVANSEASNAEFNKLAQLLHKKSNHRKLNEDEEKINMLLNAAAREKKSSP